MVVELFQEDMQLKNFSAEVISVTDGKFIVLNQTAFYPKSGGVDNDVGVITHNGVDYNVVYVGKFKGQISHEVDKEGLQVGDKITAKIDWDRRYLLMRYHTAAHVLSGMFYKNLGAKIGGNDLNTQQGRIDFNLENFDRSLIEEQVAKANELITSDLPVKSYFITREEFSADNNLMKLLMTLPDSLTHIRIVEIQGFDRQPDGGCHVSSLAQIGKIEVIKLQNKGKNNRRLYYQLFDI